MRPFLSRHSHGEWLRMAALLRVCERRVDTTPGKMAPSAYSMSGVTMTVSELSAFSALLVLIPHSTSLHIPKLRCALADTRVPAHLHPVVYS